MISCRFQKTETFYIMKELKFTLPAIIAIALVSSGCNNGVGEETNNSIEGDKVEVNAEMQRKQKEELSNDFLGEFIGTQESYFMKNQFGEDMIIAGNKISVPESGFAFKLNENNGARLVQRNRQTNQRYYYDGSYKIISDTSELIIMEVSLSDGEGSSPTYILEINKSDKKGKCVSDNGPTFNLSYREPMSL